MIKKGTQVEILCGKDKGKKGEVIEIIRDEVPKHVGLYIYEKDYLECVRPSRRHNKDLLDDETVKSLHVKMGYRFTKMHSDKKKQFLKES